MDFSIVLSGRFEQVVFVLQSEYVGNMLSILRVTHLNLQAQGMDGLLSQLAETAAQERALLEECGDLLSMAASLEVILGVFSLMLTLRS